MSSPFIFFFSLLCLAQYCLLPFLFALQRVKNGPSQKGEKLFFKTNNRLMQIKSIAILLTFMKLPIVIKIFVLSIFEWPLKTGFTVIKIVFDFLKM